MAVTNSAAPILVLRFADVGVAVYGSLRVVGAPDQLITWVLAADEVRAVNAALDQALPDLLPAEHLSDALARSLTAGPFSTAERERELATLLGALLPGRVWDLLRRCADPPGAPMLFVSPSSRLSRVPWSLLLESGGDRRLIDLADVLLAVPPNIVNTPRQQPYSMTGPPVLVLDPRVPGQRPDSALGSVLGRPSADTALVRHFADRPALPPVTEPVEYFRRNDADRYWLADQLDQRPSRMLYVGHASAAPDREGHADRAALHLAESDPLTAADIMMMGLAVPPVVALLACASGGDYRFDEATGLVAAMILGGAQVVTATLWSLPTTAGYRTAHPPMAGKSADPMSDVVIAVDTAHGTAAPTHAVNQWQRGCLQRWRTDDTALSPLYWAALVTFAVPGAR